MSVIARSLSESYDSESGHVTYTADLTRPIAELADVPWVLEPARTAARTWAEALCRDAGFCSRANCGVEDAGWLAWERAKASRAVAVGDQFGQQRGCQAVVGQVVVQRSEVGGFVAHAGFDGGTRTSKPSVQP